METIPDTISSSCTYIHTTPNPFEEIPLYRYLTFNRFLETLEKGLFIPKASLFEDRWEAMVYHMHEYLKERNTNISLKESNVSTLNDSRITAIHNSIREGMTKIYASCWNSVDHECVAMWKLYGKDKNAVILETNVMELLRAFIKFNELEKKEWLANLLIVKYVLPGDLNCGDVFSGESCLWENGFQGAFSESFDCRKIDSAYTGLQFKHKSYFFENEYRLLVVHKDMLERPENGIVIPLKKSSFIKRVILQPDSLDTFKGVVQDCLNKYNFANVSVEKSLLDELPPLKR